MIRTAVMFSGQARTFASCYQLMYWKVLRHFVNPTFFVSVAEDEQAPTMNALNIHFDDVRIEYVQQPEFPDAGAFLERSNFSAYGVAAHVAKNPGNVLKAFWHYKRVWEMIKNPDDYQVFVRIRPDLWFLEYEKPGDPFSNEAIVPQWGRFGGINDRFAIMGRQAAEAYMTSFDRIPQLLNDGCPFHPESLTRASLEMKDIKIRFTLRSYFLFRRLKTQIHPRENSLGQTEWLCGEPESAFHHRLYE